MKLNERKDRIRKLNNRMDILSRLPEVIAYNKWMVMDNYHKSILLDKWNEYYEKCKQTVSSTDYQKARVALKENNITEVKRISKLASERKLAGNYLPQPSSFDPSLLEKDPVVKNYVQVKSELDDLVSYTPISASEIFN